MITVRGVPIIHARPAPRNRALNSWPFPYCTAEVHMRTQLPEATLLGGIIGIALIPLEHRLALTACCWLLGIIGAAIILNWSIVAANFAGHSKRMTVNGLNFICYAGGNVIGPFMFDPAESPRYMSAIKALCGVYASCMFFTACIGALMWWENSKRDARLAGAAGSEAVPDDGAEANEIGFTDRTDKENPHFRYKL